jgi:hypothetical protein
MDQGYEGIFLKQRVNLAPKEKKAYNTRKADNQSSLESPDERNPLFEVVMWHLLFLFFPTHTVS